MDTMFKKPREGQKNDLQIAPKPCAWIVNCEVNDSVIRLKLQAPKVQLRNHISQLVHETSS